MKAIFITTLIFACSLTLYSQSTKVSKEIEKFTGTWFLVYQNGDEGDMLFEKKDINNYRWGNYITILANGDVMVGYSAPCGNDTKIFMNFGKWDYTSDSKEFKSSISVHKKGKSFKVRFDSKNKMVFE